MSPILAINQWANNEAFYNYSLHFHCFFFHCNCVSKVYLVIAENWNFHTDGFVIFIMLSFESLALRF